MIIVGAASHGSAPHLIDQVLAGQIQAAGPLTVFVNY
jgi:hypothetical protein